MKNNIYKTKKKCIQTKKVFPPPPPLPTPKEINFDHFSSCEKGIYKKKTFIIL